MDEIFVKKFENMWKASSGRAWSRKSHGQTGRSLVWCRKCSGYVWQRMGSKLIKSCMPEPMGTKEFGKMVKRIQTLDEGRVPARGAKNWRIEGE